MHHLSDALLQLLVALEDAAIIPHSAARQTNEAPGATESNVFRGSSNMVVLFCWTPLKSRDPSSILRNAHDALVCLSVSGLLICKRPIFHSLFVDRCFRTFGQVFKDGSFGHLSPFSIQYLTGAL